MALLRMVSRLLVGVLFIISGLIKINDPVGTQIKLEEYFEVFASSFSPVFHEFIPAALVLSVVLSVLEIVLGVALLLNYRPKLTTATLLVIIIFFTGLTFFSAVTGKVTDCGCFGDVLKLTPWQSFIKDIVLLVFILFLVISYRKDGSPQASPGAGLWVLASTLVFTALAIIAIEHLPYFDFRAYKEGVNIVTDMQAREAPRYAYVMEKQGQVYELSEYPQESEGYTYKDIKLLNPEEATPKIVDFAIWNQEGDLTEEVLQGNKLLVIVHKVAKADAENIPAIRRLAESLQNRAEVLVVTSSDEAAYEAFRHEHQIAIPYAFGDATLLKTIMRANPGLVLLKDGVVLGKWHHNDVPEKAEVLQLLNR